VGTNKPYPELWAWKVFRLLGGKVGREKGSAAVGHIKEESINERGGQSYQTQNIAYVARKGGFQRKLVIRARG